MAKSKAGYWLTSDGLTLLCGWARDGLTDEQIAKNMNISTSTYYEYLKKYPKISESIKKNKEIVDYEVENALLKRALGYKYDEITKEVVLNKKNKEYQLTETKRVTKEVLPDTTAQIFWLKNRQPGKFRDKPQDISKDDDGVIIVDDLPK